MRLFKYFLLVCVVLGMIVAYLGLNKEPGGLGVVEGRLAQCPNTPNCVSTMSKTTDSYIPPIKILDNIDVIKMVRDVVDSHSRTKIITIKDNYVHATFSTLLGFIDDVEFYFDKDKMILHFRSASRLGHYDFGVNRKRMLRIRKDITSIINNYKT